MLDQDIRPLSEFRARVVAYIKQVRESERSLVITQRGRGVAVLLDAQTYDVIQERLELLEDIHQAEQQMKAGEGLDHETAKAKALHRIKS